MLQEVFTKNKRHITVASVTAVVCDVIQREIAIESRRKKETIDTTMEQLVSPVITTGCDQWHLRTENYLFPTDTIATAVQFLQKHDHRNNAWAAFRY